MRLSMVATQLQRNAQEIDEGSRSRQMENIGRLISQANAAHTDELVGDLYAVKRLTQSASTRNEWDKAVGKYYAIKKTFEEARRTQNEPIQTTALADLDRFMSARAESQKEKMQEAKDRLDAAANGVLAEFNRMVNYLSPDELATQWDGNRGTMRQKIDVAFSTYVDDVNIGLEEDARMILKEYFLEQISNGIKDPSKVSESAFITNDVSEVNEGGVVFSNFTDGRRVLETFGKIYGLDAALKAAVYGVPVPAEFADQSGQFSMQIFESRLGGIGKAEKIALAYLYGANGEALDRFAEFMGVEGYDKKESIEKKYGHIAGWVYDNRATLRTEYNRQAVTSRAADMLTDTQQVGDSNIARGVFDSMSVVAFAR